MTTPLEASARRALDALATLILNTPNPSTEALAAQYELRQALGIDRPEHPAVRVWQILTPRRDGSWSSWSAPIVDEAEAHGDYERTVTEYGSKRAFRLVSSLTTQTVEAEHQPATGPADGAQQQSTEADGDRIVAYRSALPGAWSVYCTRHTDDLGDGAMPLTSEDLPDGGLCAQCGADVLIQQQPAGA
jgi:hypothetical protein